MKILIMGASGTGQTTLGQALAEQLKCNVVDTDDFYWLPTIPAYQQKRDINERLSLIMSKINEPTIIVSGAVNGWGKVLEDAFDLIIFLSLDTNIRLARLEQRELLELGFIDHEFIAWAKEYENPNFSSRNRVKHEAWLAKRTAEILPIAGDLTVKQRVEHIFSKYF